MVSAEFSLGASGKTTTAVLASRMCTVSLSLLNTLLRYTSSFSKLCATNVGAFSPEKTASTDTEQEDAVSVRRSKCIPSMRGWLFMMGRPPAMIASRISDMSLMFTLFILQGYYINLSMRCAMCAVLVFLVVTYSDMNLTTRTHIPVSLVFTLYLCPR